MSPSRRKRMLAHWNSRPRPKTAIIAEALARKLNKLNSSPGHKP